MRSGLGSHVCFLTAVIGRFSECSPPDLPCKFTWIPKRSLQSNNFFWSSMSVFRRVSHNGCNSCLVVPNPESLFKRLWLLLFWCLTTECPFGKFRSHSRLVTPSLQWLERTTTPSIPHRRRGPLVARPAQRHGLVAGASGFVPHRAGGARRDQRQQPGVLGGSLPMRIKLLTLGFPVFWQLVVFWQTQVW